MNDFLTAVIAVLIVLSWPFAPFGQILIYNISNDLHLTTGAELFIAAWCLTVGAIYVGGKALEAYNA